MHSKWNEGQEELGEKCRGKNLAKKKKPALKKNRVNNDRLERRFRNIGVDVRGRNETIGTLRTQIRDKGYIIEYLQKSLRNVTDERYWLADIVADMENETVSFF